MKRPEQEKRPRFIQIHQAFLRGINFFVDSFDKIWQEVHKALI